MEFTLPVWQTDRENDEGEPDNLRAAVAESQSVNSQPVTSQPVTSQLAPGGAVADSTALPAEFTRADAGTQVRGSGSVTRILSDDNNGSRHQRFILRLASGQTLLIAHNIDLAPRVAALAINDRVEFYGEYEWNSQGGVVHWTHNDPAGRHTNGWLRSKGSSFQ